LPVVAISLTLGVWIVPPLLVTLSLRHVAAASVGPMQGFDVAAAATRLRSAGGGYEVVHESPGLEIGVYVLVAPEPDRQSPHAFDEIYVVLDGEGEIEVDGETRRVAKDEAVFVSAHADHRFSDYVTLSLLVIFNGAHSATKSAV